MARYEKTGLITDLITGEARKPIYGDFTGLGNYHDLRSRLARANEVFDALPAKIRNHFENDPQKLVDFVAEADHEQMFEAGLITIDEVEANREKNKPQPEKKDEPAAPVNPQPANPAAKQ